MCFFYMIASLTPHLSFYFSRTETITTTTRVITKTSSANQAVAKVAVGKSTKATTPARSSSKPAIKAGAGKMGPAKVSPQPRRNSTNLSLRAMPRMPALMGPGNSQLMITDGQDMGVGGMDGWMIPF